jgi:hypothetical protein
MGDALTSLEAQYIFLTNHLDEYLGACKKETDQNSIRSAYVDSRRNYWSCINKIFHDDDPRVAATVREVMTAQQSLEDSLEQLNNVTKIINIVTSAVKVGAQLASLAA